MNESFKDAYHQLSISDKRNELNNEMELAYRLLLAIKRQIGSNQNENENESITNYDISKDANLSESEMLDLLYYDFYIIQKNIIDIADTLMKNNQQ